MPFRLLGIKWGSFTSIFGQLLLSSEMCLLMLFFILTLFVVSFDKMRVGSHSIFAVFFFKKCHFLTKICMTGCIRILTTDDVFRFIFTRFIVILNRFGLDQVFLVDL